MRTKKALWNTVAGLSYQIIALICVMILPRLILSSFGSNYNGVTSSISQFLSCVVLLKAGIGGVTRAALYKPLAENNINEISRIIKATEIYLKKIAIIFVVGLVLLACIYPIFVKDEFEWLFVSSLVIILGISTFFEYYFGLTYQILLIADQRQYIISLVQIITTVLNTLIACVLIKCGFGIHIVKLGSAFAFGINPLIINAYSRRRYKISRKVEPDNKAVEQRWDAFSHQIANFVYMNTDIVVLTIFSNVWEVSVYTVYYLVITGLNKLLKNTIQGVSSAFGNMIARKEKKSLCENFDIFEMFVFSLSTILFVPCGLLIVPFVKLYTSGINDVNYTRYGFAVLITLAAFFGCIRLPYQQVVDAAGHYKQTKNGAFFEAVSNILISILGVFRFGLIGVSVGTLFATVFRTVQYSTYLSKNIIIRNNINFFKHVLISGVVAFLSYVCYYLMPDVEINSNLRWMIVAFIVCCVTIILVIITNLLFFRKETFSFIKKVLNALKGKKK